MPFMPSGSYVCSVSITSSILLTYLGGNRGLICTAFTAALPCAFAIAYGHVKKKGVTIVQGELNAIHLPTFASLRL